MDKKLTCKKCGTEYEQGDMFCSNCCSSLEPILDRYMDSPKEVAQEIVTEDGMPSLKENNVLGDLEIAGTKINAEAYHSDSSVDNSQVITDNSSIISTSQSTVYNQTVIDESKQTVTCQVSGRKVLVTSSCECPSCGRVVATQCFLDDKLRCIQCEKEAESAYNDFYTKVTARGGIIDASARDILDKKAEALKLNDKQKSEIEFLLRKTAKKQSSSKLSGMRQKEFDRISQMVQSGEIGVDIALSKIESIRNTTQDEDVLFWYYLLLAIASPKRYNEELNRADVDIYWQHYWSFLANLNNGHIDRAAVCIDELKSKYEDNVNDCSVAESILLLKRYIDTNDVSYWRDAKSNIKLITGVESSQLSLIYLHLCAIIGMPSGKEQSGALYTKTLLPIPKAKIPQSANQTAPTSVKIGGGANSSSAAKGFVLDDSAGAPLKVKPVPSAAAKSKARAAFDIVVTAVFAIIAVVGLLILILPKSEDSSASDSSTDNVVTETTYEPQVSVLDEEEAPTTMASAAKVSTASTSTTATTATTSSSSTSTMVSKASSASSTSSSQAATLYAQAESAYNKSSYNEAIGLYTQAANAGSKDACLKLSSIYTTGVGGISPNAMKAKIWSDKASKLN